MVTTRSRRDTNSAFGSRSQPSPSLRRHRHSISSSLSPDVGQNVLVVSKHTVDGRTRQAQRRVRKKSGARHQSQDPTQATSPPDLLPPLPGGSFGLIQERLAPNIYNLLVQAILWNQTSGRAARPVLQQILHAYPSPIALAAASAPDLLAFLQPIGLQNQRAQRLIAFAKTWVGAPPCKHRRYTRKGYPHQGVGSQGKKINGPTQEHDPKDGWEVAHLPGVGPYALDSFRIFARDHLRGAPGNLEEAEWKRVRPSDKDLRAYLEWRWRQDGFIWDPQTGRTRSMEACQKEGS